MVLPSLISPRMTISAFFSGHPVRGQNSVRVQVHVGSVQAGGHPV